MPPPKIIYYRRTTTVSFCHTQQGQNPSILLACVILPMGNKEWARSQMWQIPKITLWALTRLTIKWCKDNKKVAKDNKWQDISTSLFSIKRPTMKWWNFTAESHAGLSFLEWKRLLMQKQCLAAFPSWDNPHRQTVTTLRILLLWSYKTHCLEFLASGYGWNPLFSFWAWMKY